MRPMNPLTSGYENDNLKKDRKHIQDFHDEIIQATNRTLRQAYIDYVDSNKLSSEQMQILNKFVTHLEGYKTR